MALVFGRDAVCASCLGRGWLGWRDGHKGRRPAYPTEIAAHARGETVRIEPCRTCGCTGLVHYRYA